MQSFSHSSPESNGRSQRLGSRAYIFIVASVATILLITALNRPARVSITAQAALTVPPLAAAHNQDAEQQSWAGRITSKELGASGRLSHTQSDEVLEAEDRVILAENAIEKFVTEHVERRREGLFALRVQQAEEQRRAQVLQRAEKAEQRAIDERAAQKELDVKDEDKRLFAADNRNPEHDVLERALVKAQTERQELLSRFATDHAAVSRVDLEIGQLELLLDQTAKSLGVAAVGQEPTGRGQEAEIDLKIDLEPGTSDAVPLPPEEINMELELARIEKSDAYRELQERLVEAQQALAAVIDSSTQAGGQLVITEAQRVVGHRQRGLRMWQLVAFGAVAGLAGFIFFVVKKFLNIPKVLYSVKDVKKFLGLPITACLSLDDTPIIPDSPELIHAVSSN